MVLQMSLRIWKRWENSDSARSVGSSGRYASEVLPQSYPRGGIILVITVGEICDLNHTSFDRLVLILIHRFNILKETVSKNHKNRGGKG